MSVMLVESERVAALRRRGNGCYGDIYANREAFKQRRAIVVVGR